MSVITFFNNKGGVGKSTFAYHMAYMLERLGSNVLMVDLDPQCNLTAHVCSDEEIEDIWSANDRSVYHAVKPLTSGAGDIKNISPYQIENSEKRRDLYLLPGDLLLSGFDSFLAESWVQVLARQERGFRALSAIHRLINEIRKDYRIDYTIIDVGPNFGSLNRAVMLGCDAFFVPMIPDLFSLRGSQNLGRVLADWIDQYRDVVARVNMEFLVPTGSPTFCGYITQQFNTYRNRETRSWEQWSQKIPDYVNKYIIQPLKKVEKDSLLVIQDSGKLGEFKNYHSLMPMAQSARKPVFELMSTDGVVGSHHEYVKRCGEDFENMAGYLKQRMDQVKISP